MKFFHQVRRRHAEAGDERLGAALDDEVGGALQRLRHGGEKVDTERLVRVVARDFHLALDVVERTARHAETAEAAGLRHRGSEFAIRNAAHAREHDGVLDAEHVAEWRADGHGRFLNSVSSKRS